MEDLDQSPQESTPADSEASIYTGPIVAAYMAGTLAISGAVELGLGAPEQVSDGSFISAATLAIGALCGAVYAYRLHRRNR